MSIDADTEFETYRIKSVIAHSPDGWTLEFDDGACLLCRGDACKEPPEAGEYAALYGRGFGYPVRGIRIGKRVYRYETADDYAARCQRETEERDKQRAVETAEMLVRESARAEAGEKYAWRDGMGEISGFGGGYEEACRQMLRAGLRWLDEHPCADPRFRGFKGVFGVIADDNEDAKALSAAVASACDDCTGAMHQATVSACLYVKANGWDAYCAAMSRRDA